MTPRSSSPSVMTKTPIEARRVEEEPGFVLQTYPWRETSLIVEVLTRDYGRVSLVAKGAKRPASKFRGLLNPFSPLLFSFSGKSEVRTLTDVSWLGTLALSESALMAAFYMNELVMRLTGRLDPNPALFSAYSRALKELAQGAGRTVVLRHFELDLLQAIGYGLPESEFESDWYAYRGGDFFAVDSPNQNYGLPVRGETLRRMKAGRITVGEEESEVRSLTREMIRYYLDGKQLSTRRIMEEIRSL